MDKNDKKFKITINSPVVIGMVTICFVVMLINYITGGKAVEYVFMTFRSPISSPMTWIRSITHVFGHSGWDHLIGNMSYILLIGPLLEEKYGSKVMIEVILITAIITSILNGLLFPNIGLCGASGVVFAFILLSSFTGFKEGEIPLTFIMVAVFFLGQQVYEGIVVDDNISNSAHIIGGIVGGFCGYILNKKSPYDEQVESL
jgi:GlpG protein